MPGQEGSRNDEENTEGEGKSLMSPGPLRDGHQESDLSLQMGD